MWSYALSTPIKRGVWTPPPEEKIPVPPPASEQTQNHRTLNWLIGKNPSHGIFPKPPQSGRAEGKVFYPNYK